jgi:hypothetical protein
LRRLWRRSSCRTTTQHARNFTAADDDIVIVTTKSGKRNLDDGRTLIVDTINYLNFQFVRSTEIVLALFNDTSLTFNPQVTMFRFLPDCYEECVRAPPSQRNAIAAWQNKGSSRMITPDYRPEPVAGAARWMDGLQAVLLLERDVLEIRTNGLASLISIVNDVNAATD